jgi:hypothetical protein
MQAALRAVRVELGLRENADEPASISGVHATLREPAGGTLPDVPARTTPVPAQRGFVVPPLLGLSVMLALLALAVAWRWPGRAGQVKAELPVAVQHAAAAREAPAPSASGVPDSTVVAEPQAAQPVVAPRAPVSAAPRAAAPRPARSRRPAREPHSAATPAARADILDQRN